MAARGRGPDSTLVHMSPREVQGLQALAKTQGQSLTINPQTGLPEAGILENLLPALAGFALDAFAPGVGSAVGGMLGLEGAAASTVGTGLLVGGATGLVSGSLEKGLMAGLGGAGGAGLAESAFGASAAGKAAASGAADVAAAKSPMGTFDRLSSMKEGAGNLFSAPKDALKDNMFNIGLAGLPLLTGAFDSQSSSAAKPNYGNIRRFKTDPVTGRSYQYEVIPAEEFGNRSAIEWGGVPPAQRAANGGLMQHYDSGGTTNPYNPNGITTWGRAPSPTYTLPDTPDLRSDSQKAQDYLMGGKNPFLFKQGVAVDPLVEKAKEAANPNSVAAAQVAANNQFANKGGGSGNSQLNKSFFDNGYEGATTNESGDSGPLTGAALSANQMAAKLGNLGLVGLSDAIAKNVDPNYGHEAMKAANILAQRKAEQDQLEARQIAENQSLAESNRLAADQKAAEQKAAELAAENQSQAETNRLAAQNNLNNAPPVAQPTNESQAETNRLSAQNAQASRSTPIGVWSGQAAAGSDVGRSQPGEAHREGAKGGYLKNGKFNQRYAGGGIAALHYAAGGDSGTGNIGGNSGGDSSNNANYDQTDPYSKYLAMKAAMMANPGAQSQMDKNGDEYIWDSAQQKWIFMGAPPPKGYNPKNAVAPKFGYSGTDHALLKERQDEQDSPDYFYNRPVEEMAGKYADSPFMTAMANIGLAAFPFRTPMAIKVQDALSMAEQFKTQKDNLGKAPVFAPDSPELQAMKEQYQQYPSGVTYNNPPPEAAPPATSDYQSPVDRGLPDPARSMEGFGSETGQRDSSPSPSPGAVNGGENGGWGSRDAGGGGDARGGYLNHGRFDQRYAYGGIAALANGGYNLGSYSDGGRLLRGPGDGVSDNIPATIGHNQPARLADGEFVVPARIVSELGNGSTEAGARKLYAMMDRVQKARSKTVGKDKVAANSRADKYLPV